MITINNINNSSDLLFSIPVHENQDIINNTIENIFNFNPNCKIILHINKNFSSFSNSKSNYSNLYFNTLDIIFFELIIPSVITFIFTFFFIFFASGT